ncbi:autotransporter assembly complex protein TamA [Chitinilyticum aquatile]|uniref:autotransporter assembly complex protein TamA n=1 Tax=Chitinilyticum aquatile TaxID=362520 RepID=UPI0004033DBD|nr:autotransporter assembly complex family protein [Chitinilyticum aquatile]
MLNAYPFLGLACLSAVCCAAEAPATVLHYRVQIVAPGDLRDLLEKHLDLVKWQGDPRLTQEQLERLIATAPEGAAALLATEGYFTPDIRVNQQGTPDKPEIILSVEPGRPVLVSKIDVQLQGAITEQAEQESRLNERIESGWALETGQRFQQSLWDQSKRIALDRLLARDYPTARIVASQALIDPESATAQLSLTLDSGPAYTYGPLRIEGLQRYPEKMVRNHVKFAEGDSYRRRQMLNLQTDLQNLPQFSSVLVEPDFADESPFNAPVTVRVVEAPLHKVGLGAGYSTNTGLRTTLDYRYLNLFGEGLTFSSKFNLEQKEQTIDVNILFPRDPRGYDFASYVNLKKNDIAGLETTSYTVGTSRMKQEFRLERTMVLEYQTEDRSSTGISQNPQALTFNYILKSREIDSIRDPRDGLLAQVEIGGATEALLSDTSFLRVYGRGIQYLKMPGNGVVIGRLELGQTFASNESTVPTNWLFRAGGTNSVRGYGYQTLGIQGNGATLPGQVLATASLEIQQPVYKDWRAAVFVDYGGAEKNWSSLDPVTGTGIGARWISPAGSLGADIAYGIDARQWRLSLALGLAL